MAEPGGVILDAVGDLVWRQIDQGGDTQDLRVQEYFGEKYLTFWVGEEIGGRKQGSWFMVREDENNLAMCQLTKLDG